MDLFIKCATGGLLTVILGIALEKQGKDTALVLSVGVCCMIIGAAASYLRPVVTFLDNLVTIGNLNSVTVSSLFKILGIGILTEITAMVCTDAGNSSLGKALQFLGTGVILWLSLPIFTALIDLIGQILGEL